MLRKTKMNWNERNRIVNDMKRFKIIGEYYQRNKDRITPKNMEYIEGVIREISSTELVGYSMWLKEDHPTCIVKETSNIIRILGRKK
jgi:hypothetical protein